MTDKEEQTNDSIHDSLSGTVGPTEGLNDANIDSGSDESFVNVSSDDQINGSNSPSLKGSDVDESINGADTRDNNEANNGANDGTNDKAINEASDKFFDLKIEVHTDELNDVHDVEVKVHEDVADVADSTEGANGPKVSDVNNEHFKDENEIETGTDTDTDGNTTEVETATDGSEVSSSEETDSTSDEEYLSSTSSEQNETSNDELEIETGTETETETEAETEAEAETGTDTETEAETSDNETNDDKTDDGDKPHTSNDDLVDVNDQELIAELEKSGTSQLSESVSLIKGLIDRIKKLGLSQPEEILEHHKILETAAEQSPPDTSNPSAAEKSPPDKPKPSAAERHATLQKNIFEKIREVIVGNRIKESSKGFGFKFLSVCIFCALGGRRGYHRYIESPRAQHLKLWKIKWYRLKGCKNPGGDLNVRQLCYIGHILLYYLSDPNLKNALIVKYGDFQDIIISRRNVRREIGGPHLWHPARELNYLAEKPRILDEYERRFDFNEVEFAKVLSYLGIEV